MSGEPGEGHDQPYDAPCVVTGCNVLPEWIDYNGHMNGAYYAIAFDNALDVFLSDELGIGEEFTIRTQQSLYVLQAQTHFLAEMLDGASYEVRIQLIDYDTKLMHLFFSMFSVESDVISATCEQMLMNVDLTKRCPVTYPEWAQARIAAMAQAHAGLERPAQLGAPLAIRRRE